MENVIEEVCGQMNEFEEQLREGDIDRKELLEFEKSLDEGIGHIETLLDLHNSLPDDTSSLPEPVMESLNIYLDRTMDHLGLERISLEDTAMAPYQEWKIEGEGNKKQGLWNKIAEMIKKIFRAIIAFFAKIIDAFKSKYNIIFVMMDKIFHNYDKALEGLDPKFVEEHRKLEVKNSTLARYFRVTDGHLAINVAFNLCDQYKFFDSIILHIADSLLKHFEDLKKGKLDESNHYQLDRKDVGDIISKLDKLVLVNGFTFTVDENNNIIRNSFDRRLSDEFILDVGNKESLINLNKENKENAKNIVQTYNKASGSSFNYWLQGKLIGAFEETIVGNYKKKYPNSSEEAIKQVRGRMDMIKKTLLAGSKLLNDMFYLETESYRANVKFLGVSLKSLHSIKK